MNSRTAPVAKIKPIKRLVRRYPQSHINVLEDGTTGSVMYPSADEPAISFSYQLPSARDILPHEVREVPLLRRTMDDAINITVN